MSKKVLILSSFGPFRPNPKIILSIVWAFAFISKRIRRKFAISRQSSTKQQYAMPVSFSFKFRFGRLGGWEPKARRRLPRRLLGKRFRWSKCVASKNSTTNVEGKQMPMSAQIMLKGFVKSAPLNKHYMHRIRGTVSSRNIKYVSFGERINCL